MKTCDIVVGDHFRLLFSYQQVAESLVSFIHSSRTELAVNMFDIKGKVAIVTGGASGIGLRYAKELLKNGLRAVTISDVNEEFGQNALGEIEKEFGASKALFVKCDVTKKEEFEEVFKRTIAAFKNLDILINNAGILNDAVWEKEIAININGVVHGTLLAIHEYMPKYKSSSEGVIVNISSIAGLEEYPNIPVYVATKHAVLGLSRSFGSIHLYKRTNVRVLTLCPGVTITPLITEMSGRNLGPIYEEIGNSVLRDLPAQEPECVAKAMVKIIREGKSGSVWVAEGGVEAYEVEFPSREIRKK